MIWRYAIFSVSLSLLSIALVFLAPFNVSTELPAIESPYSAEIEKLRSKEYLVREEKDLLDRLVKDNNEYLLSRAHQHSQESAWRKKSDYLAPLVMLVWGAAFYRLYRKYTFRHFYIVGAVPVLLGLIGVMSVIEVLLILASVFLVVVVVSIRHPGR